MENTLTYDGKQYLKVSVHDDFNAVLYTKKNDDVRFFENIELDDLKTSKDNVKLAIINTEDEGYKCLIIKNAQFLKKV